MTENNPAVAEITKAVLKSFNGVERDITGTFIGVVSIDQSMDTASWSGTMSVRDSAGVLDSLPIRGEESLELWIKSFDLGTEIKLNARVHKVTDIIPTATSNGVTYKLHFVSDVTYNGSLVKITKAYNRPINDIVKRIFNEYYWPIGQADYLDRDNRSKTLPFATARYPLENQNPERSIHIQPTVGIQKLIIPRLSSSEALFFAASRGFNPETASQSYKFFETIEDFYFCSDEYFLTGLTDDDITYLHYSPVGSFTTEDLDSQIMRVDQMQIVSKGIDTSTDIFSGSYRNEVTEIDLVRGILNISKFNYDDARYIDMTGAPRSDETNPHTAEFRAATFTENNARRFMIFKDYQSNGDTPSPLANDRNLTSIFHNRVSYYHHLNNTIIAVSLKGRLDIRPGKVVHLTFKNFDGVSSSVDDNIISGRYLVKATNHTFAEGVLETSLRLVKFDWSARSNIANPQTPSAPRSTT